MANGYCTSILAHIEALAGTNPAKKLPVLGFLNAILSNMDGSVKEQPINQGNEMGHTRPLVVKYRKRGTIDEVSDTESCDASTSPVYNEFTLPSLLYRQISFWLPDATIRQYCKDVSEKVKISGDAAVMDGDTAVMREIYDLLVEKGGTLLQAVNQALVTQMSTQFGTNIVTGNNNATPLTFNLGSNAMQDAFVRLMSDLSDNEMTRNITIVGNGPFTSIEDIRRWFANAAADNGINKAQMLADIPRIWKDNSTKTIWGANQIGVFEKGSIHLMSQNNYEGSFARKLANSTLFTMSLPVEEYNIQQEFLRKLRFDVQLREIDCPTQINIDGTPTTVSEGVEVILKWRGNLFVKPEELFDAADPLFGTNGTLRYSITESA